MIKVTSLVIGCSLLLGGSALAQPPDAQQHGKKQPAKSHVQARPARVAKGPSNGPKPHGPPVQHAISRPQRAQVQRSNNQRNQHVAKANVARERVNTAANHNRVQRNNKVKTAVAAQKMAPSGNSAVDTNATNNAAQATNDRNRQANVGHGAKRPDQQQIRQIRQQNANFHAQPKPQQAPAVTYNQNYRIQGSDRWQGRQYQAFRSYRAERHDRDWYRSRYHQIELIGGGYYYWNNGYWFPAWGYDPADEYYAYDGPIYVGRSAVPPDRVIADVQSALQQMGYYRGEVDGLLGPMTREALTAYQADQGLIETAAIDEPTLDALGLG